VAGRADQGLDETSQRGLDLISIKKTGDVFIDFKTSDKIKQRNEYRRRTQRQTVFETRILSELGIGRCWPRLALDD
jgi:hypothetical protein